MDFRRWILPFNCLGCGGSGGSFATKNTGLVYLQSLLDSKHWALILEASSGAPRFNKVALRLRRGPLSFTLFEGYLLLFSARMEEKASPGDTASTVLIRKKIFLFPKHRGFTRNAWGDSFRGPSSDLSWLLIFRLFYILFLFIFHSFEAFIVWQWSLCQSTW